MTTYSPAPGVFVGRPPCATCGANLQLHTLPPGALEHTVVVRGAASEYERRYITSRGLQRLLDAGVQLQCPVPYRPPTVAEAQAQLEAAIASGDEARIFVARGEYQRLVGRK